MTYRDDDERRALTPDDPVGAVVDAILTQARARPGESSALGRHSAVWALLCWRAGHPRDAVSG